MITQKQAAEDFISTFPCYMMSRHNAFIALFKAGAEWQANQQVKYEMKEIDCGIHSTDWHGKCFKCGTQVFDRNNEADEILG